MSNTGWICPKCDRVFAPSVEECDYCNPGDEEKAEEQPPVSIPTPFPFPEVEPFQPYHPYPPFKPWIDKSGICTCNSGIYGYCPVHGYCGPNPFTITWTSDSTAQCSGCSGGIKCSQCEIKERLKPLTCDLGCGCECCCD